MTTAIPRRRPDSDPRWRSGSGLRLRPRL